MGLSGEKSIKEATFTRWKYSGAECGVSAQVGAGRTNGTLERGCRNENLLRPSTVTRDLPATERPQMISEQI